MTARGVSLSLSLLSEVGGEVSEEERISVVFSRLLRRKKKGGRVGTEESMREERERERERQGPENVRQYKRKDSLVSSRKERRWKKGRVKERDRSGWKEGKGNLPFPVVVVFFFFIQ